MRQSFLPTRAVVILAGVAILTTIVAVGALLWELRVRDLAHSAREAASIARLLIEQTDEALASTDIALRTVQERLDAPFGRSVALDSDAVHLLLSSRVAGLPEVGALGIVGPDGRILNSSRADRGNGRSASQRRYFQVLAANADAGLYVDRAERSLATGVWTLHLARRLQGPGGEFRGVVVAAIDLVRFEQLYDHMRLDHVRPIALYLDDGTLVASSPHREGDVGDLASELRGVALPAEPGRVALVTRVLGDAPASSLAIGRAAGFPLIVSVLDDPVETLAAWRETAFKIALGAALVSIFLALAAASLVKQLQRDEQLALALSDADERYQQMMKNTMDAVVAVDDAQRIVLFNPAAEHMFGIARDEALGQPLDILLPPQARDAHAGHLERLAQSPAQSRPMAPHREVVARHSSGREFPVETTITTTMVNGQLQFTSVLRDITERRRNEEALRALNDELRRLSSVLQSVREQERQRIALELHDELGQQLTGIKLELSWVALRLKEGRPLDPAAIDGMRQMLDASIVAVRRISTELRPRILDERDFGEAVRWQAAEFARRSAIAVSVELPASSLVRDTDVATALFRIVQEALTNVARHAGARHVFIRLVNDEEQLTLSIADDGTGLAPSAHRGVGLLSMRERACALGGEFAVSARDDGGTLVEVRIPLPAREEAAVDA